MFYADRYYFTRICVKLLREMPHEHLRKPMKYLGKIDCRSKRTSKYWIKAPRFTCMNSSRGRNTKKKHHYSNLEFLFLFLLSQAN